MKVIKFIKNPAVIMIAAAVILTTLVTIGFIRSCSQREKAKAEPVIIFYDLDNNIEELLQKEISSIAEGLKVKYEFKSVSSDKKLSSYDSANCELIITKSGRLSKSLSENSMLIDEAIFEAVPNSLSGNKKILPLILDHNEVSFYTVPQKKLNLLIPSTWEDFEDFLTKEKESSIIENPSICAGKNDKELFAFVSNMALKEIGLEGYKNLVQELSSSNGKVITPLLASVLDKIIELQKKGLIHKEWFNVTENDLLQYYFKERKTGVYFMSLSLHRKVQQLYIKYFKTTDFPKKAESKKEAVTGSMICALQMNNNFKGSELLKALLSNQVQETLTNESTLAPVNKKCMAYDSQADDVRYWAASSPYGLISDISYEAFEEAKKRSLLASSIRKYLEYAGSKTE